MSRPDVTDRQPATGRSTDIVIVVAIGLGAGALVLHAWDVVRMPFTISFLALPGLLLATGLVVRSHGRGETLLARRAATGLVIGVFALLAYDVSRALIALATPSSFDPFRAHRNYGAAMLATEPQTTAALVAGWTYHVWNGLSFAVMYTVAVGRGRMSWALLWAIGLETATIVVTPSVTGISRTDIPFIAVSLLGHLFFGLVLGWLAREWLPGPPGARAWQLWRPTALGGPR